jgi:hypothetical protein
MILKEPLLPQGPALHTYPTVKLRARRRLPPATFLVKLAAAALLVALADLLFYRNAIGGTLGLFAFAWVLALALAVPGVRKSPRARPALAAAVLMSLVLAYDPGFLAFLLFLAALFLAGVLPFRPFDDAARFAARFVLHAVLAVAAPLRDIRQLLAIPRPNLRNSTLRVAAALGLPLAGGIVFVALFASANPLIENFLPTIVLPEIEALRVILWGVTFTAAWLSLRPLRSVLGLKFAFAGRGITLPGVNVLSITVSLILFNALFAVENILDLAFLWSGAPLPKGVTLADYAHRGAYPLIVTALLAALFVLLTAKPDSEAARRPLIRRLVVLWVAQNVFLVMSSALRTIDYIDAYMLTVLRIAALAWMGLVALGLVLICWRMLKGLSLRWLINANALSAVSVLGFFTIVDPASIAAGWNASHAREVGGQGQALDTGYLIGLGGPALLPLAGLEGRAAPGEFRRRVALARQVIHDDLLKAQDRPYAWTLRNAVILYREAAFAQRTAGEPAVKP